jgi:hypothetical protein
LLSEAAYALRALGRLTEALAPMRVSVKMAEDAAEWKEAARRAGNLSELEVTLGLLPEAESDAQRAHDFAARSGNEFRRMSTRTTTAYALHQSGKQAEAKTLFVEAERFQAKRQPQFPLLYALIGFRYVDLLLAPAERAAWQAVLGAGYQPGTSKTQDVGQDAPAAVCVEAERRARTNIEQHSNLSLLSIALDDLALTRAHLYRALLSADPADAIADSQSEVHAALAKLRQANQIDYLPNALLTAALYAQGLAEKPDEARRYLAEAQQIAERGPMPLYLAEVHLYRARLFRDRSELANARALIEKHGYGRRKEELEDAEVAL